jgi:FixJ family two-component response regulator
MRFKSGLAASEEASETRVSALTGTIYIIDDDLDEAGCIAEGLRSAGHHAVIFESPLQLLLAHDRSQLGCLLLNADLRQPEPLELQAVISCLGNLPPVIFFSRHGTIGLAVHALRSGAVDFLLKPLELRSLLGAVAEALCIDAARHYLFHARDMLRPRLMTLTRREREVLELVMAGKRNKQIAAELGTVEKTVKVHRARAMRKLHVRSVPELLAMVRTIEESLSPSHPVRLLEKARSEGSSAPPSLSTAPALLDNLSLGAWEWNIASDSVVCDEHLARVFEVDRSIARSGAPLAAYTARVHTQDSSRLAELIRAAIDNGDEFNATYRVCHSNGRQCLVLALGRVEYDRLGKPVRFPGVMVDISKYPQLERASPQARTGLLGKAWPVAFEMV